MAGKAPEDWFHASTARVVLACNREALLLRATDSDAASSTCWYRCMGGSPVEACDHTRVQGSRLHLMQSRCGQPIPMGAIDVSTTNKKAPAACVPSRLVNDGETSRASEAWLLALALVFAFSSTRLRAL